MTETAPPKVNYRSFSKLKSIRTCGEQYRLERVERVPSRPSWAAVAGTVIHTGTETVDNMIHNGEVDRDLLIDTATAATLVALDEEIVRRSGDFLPEQWKAYGRSTKQNEAWWRQQGIPNSIRSYVDWRLANQEFTLALVPDFGPAIELPFWYYLPSGELINGYIDRVFTHSGVGGFYPFDLKSGLKPKTDEQLGLYSLALRKTLGWDARWGYYLYGLKTGEAKLTRPIDLSHWTEQKLDAEYGPAARAIDAGIYIPNPGEACFHCGVTEHCAFYQSVL